MRIGMYYPGAGKRHASGISIFVQQMANNLAETHEVFLYTYTDDGQVVGHLDTDSITVVPIPDGSRRRFGSLASSLNDHLDVAIPFDNIESAVRACRNGIDDHIEANVDVLLTQDSFDDLVLSNVVDVPVVFEYHGLEHVGVICRTRERLTQTTTTLANSQFTATQIRRNLDYDVDGIVRPGVDVERFSPETPPISRPEAPVVLFVGRVIEAKGIWDLMHAVAALETECQLWIVGRGDEGTIRDRASSLGITEQTTFHGTVSHERLHQYYAACDVFCLPSHYESFGMVNLEAMACGKPVVTTDLAGTREYSKDGDNSILVSPGDVSELATALDRVLTTPNLRHELGTNGREFACQYSWGEQAAALGDICQGVLIDGRR